MRIVMLAALLAATLSAQSPSTVPVTSTIALPTNWAGAGAASDGAHIGAWFSYAILLSSKGQVYSFSSYDESLVKVNGKYQIQSSARTGLATIMKQMGPAYLLGFGDAGSATTGSTLGGAFSGGGMLLFKLGKTDWTIQAATRYIKSSTGGTQTIYEFGFGRVW